MEFVFRRKGSTSRKGMQTSDLVASTEPADNICEILKRFRRIHEKHSLLPCAHTHTQQCKLLSSSLLWIKFPEKTRQHFRHLTYFHRQVTQFTTVGIMGQITGKEPSNPGTPVSSSMKVWTTVTTSRFPEALKRCC